MENKLTWPLVFMKEFEHYVKGESVPTILADGLVFIKEPREVGDHGITMNLGDRTYIVGEAVNRLHDFERLGYTPEELRGIINSYHAMFREKSKKKRLECYTDGTEHIHTGKHRFNRDEIAAIEAALKRDDKAVTFTHTDDEVMVTIAPWSKEEE